MQNILAFKSVGMTELREPKRVLEEAGDQPVAIMNRNEVVGYFVPASAVDKLTFDTVTNEEFEKVLSSRSQALAEGMAYLQDK